MKRVLSRKRASIWKVLFSCLAFIFIGQELQVSAQDHTGSKIKFTVSGQITDTEGIPLAGTSIFVKGTSIGVSSDENGQYMIQIPSGKNRILVFSFIGMETQEIPINRSKALDITLKSDTRLDEVIVNGFYTQSKETFTGAATIIKGDDLLKVSPTNLVKAIVELTPGMELVENNAMGSDPNAIPNILIRGANTLITDNKQEGINNPVIILDGVEITMEELYDLDMFDIARVDVLKDASATILYGEKGANGVIVIERKKPDSSKIKVNYNFVPKFSYPDLSSFNLTNAEQKLELEKLAGIYDKPDGSMDEAYFYKLQNVRKGVNSNWLYEPLRLPFSHNHSASLSARMESLDFRASINFNDNYGVMKGDNRRNGGLNFSIGYHLKDKLTVSFKSSFTMTNSRKSPYGEYSDYVNMNPYEPIRDENGNLIQEYHFDPIHPGTTGDINPLYTATLSNFSKSKGHNFNNNLSARWNITKFFYITAQGSLGMSWGSSDSFKSPKDLSFKNTAMDKKGSYSFSNRENLRTDGKIVANYGRSLGHRGSMFRISAGSNIQYSRSKSTSAQAVGFFKDNLSDISFSNHYPEMGHPSGTDLISTQVGFFVNANTSFRNRYFLDLSFRTSGSSKFGSNNSFAPFWAAGLGWNLHREKFAEDWTWLNSLIFRYSVGFNGSSSFDYYQAKTVYQYNSNNLYYTGIGALPKQMGNPDLKWQRTLNNNFGLTGSFLNGRLQIGLDFYSNTTYDMLMPINLPPSVGTKSMNVNFGQINNKGIDISLSGHIIKTTDWFWSMTLTGGHVMDQIKNISSSLKGKELGDKYDSGKPKLLFEENGSQFDIYAMRSAGIDPATGKEIFIKKNGQYTYNYMADERVAVGNTNPVLQGSWHNTLRYKGFSISISTNYTFGGDFYSTTLQNKVEKIDIKHNVDERAFTDRWKKPGDLSRYLSLKETSFAHYSERFVEKRNELYISNIQFMYDFQPKAITKLGLRKLAIGFGFSDIAHISTVKFERGTSYPYCRSINITFRPTF